MKQWSDHVFPVGTKSVLFGAHCFFLHPWFVALAWTRLYGFPTDYRLWIAFFVHDLGYLGSPNMDGPEGERHVEFGAQLMERWFGAEWGAFCRYHSRFYARRDNQPFSQLCVADKLSTAMEPWWLYLPRVILSGEIDEYMALAGGKNGSKYAGEPNSPYVQEQLAMGTRRSWFRALQSYCHAWAMEHKDGRPDTWTPAPKP